MNQIDISLAEKDICANDLSCTLQVDYPICLLGVELKNNYDLQRISSKQFTAVKHDIYNINNHATRYFYGMSLEPNRRITPVIEKLMQVDALPGNTLTLPFYKNLLKAHNLNCSDCYAYFDKGVYPVNSEFIKDICREDINLNQIYHDIMFSGIAPIYQTVSYLAIYILTDTKVNFINK